MNSLLDIMRGPALGVVIMIIALAGIIVVTAFAALIAQVGLLMRLRPWQPQPAVKAQAVTERQPGSRPTRRSPSYSVHEPDESEAIDPAW